MKKVVLLFLILIVVALVIFTFLPAQEKEERGGDAPNKSTESRMEEKDLEGLKQQLRELGYLE